ncbi:MAG TPA: sensor histidine kinase [Anaerolineaceae bacterium]
MQAKPPRRQMLIAYVALYLAFAAAAARSIFELRAEPDFWWMVGLLGLYLLLLLVEPYLISRSRAFLHIINGLQTALALVLVVEVGELDFLALLFIPPCTQSILHLPRRAALIWIGVIILLMESALLVSFPLSESVGFTIIYPTAIFLFTSLSYLAKRAVEAQARSEALLADLQVANQKLQAYAAQVEELAAANERNRLARELHDSVTQIIFGLTLSAQAARILIDRNPARAAAELDHLQGLAQNALAEMRALIQELHPHSGMAGGLVPALRRLSEKRAAEGLQVDVQVAGERRLPAQVEAELFRVAQEALNNIIKHARARHALIALDIEGAGRVRLRVEDDGVGFNPAQAQAQTGHLGLTSMRERVEALGGWLEIDSQPGAGTRLVVEITLEPEVEHA